MQRKSEDKRAITLRQSTNEKSIKLPEKTLEEKKKKERKRKERKERKRKKETHSNPKIHNKSRIKTEKYNPIILNQNILSNIGDFLSR
jgi:hypothetical protein